MYNGLKIELHTNTLFYCGGADLSLACAEYLEGQYLLLLQVPRHRLAVDDGATRADVITVCVLHACNDVGILGRVVLLVAAVDPNGAVLADVNLSPETRH